MIYHSIRYDSLNHLQKTKEFIRRLSDTEIKGMLGSKPVFPCYFLDPSDDVVEDLDRLRVLSEPVGLFVKAARKDRCIAILNGLDLGLDTEVFLLYPNDFCVQKPCLDDYLEKNFQKSASFMARAFSLSREDPVSVCLNVPSKLSFSEYLFKLIDSKGMKDSEVYKRANIDRRLFSKMRDRDYIPSKKTLFSLCISMKLNLDESDDLLRLAGYAFSKARMEDIVVEYFIIHGKYDIFELNETLISYHLPTLF